MFHKSTHSISDAVAAAMKAAFGVAVYKNTDGNPKGSWTLAVVVPKSEYAEDDGWVGDVINSGDLLVPLDKLTDVQIALPPFASNPEAAPEPEQDEKAKFKAMLTEVLTRIARVAGKLDEATADAPTPSGMIMMTEDGKPVPKGEAVKSFVAAVDWQDLAEDAHAMLHGYESEDTRKQVAGLLSGLIMAAVVDGVAKAEDTLPHLACFAKGEKDGKLEFGFGGK